MGSQRVLSHLVIPYTPLHVAALNSTILTWVRSLSVPSASFNKGLVTQDFLAFCRKTNSYSLMEEKLEQFRFFRISAKKFEYTGESIRKTLTGLAQFIVRYIFNVALSLTEYVRKIFYLLSFQEEDLNK